MGDILDETTMQQLAHRDVPVVGLCSPAENIPGFPENLSLRLVRCPQLRMALETVLIPPAASTAQRNCTQIRWSHDSGSSRKGSCRRFMKSLWSTLSNGDNRTSPQARSASRTRTQLKDRTEFWIW